jgi:hypothetical protein
MLIYVAREKRTHIASILSSDIIKNEGLPMMMKHMSAAIDRASRKAAQKISVMSLLDIAKKSRFRLALRSTRKK